MRTLEAAREVCEKYLPGLQSALAALPFEEREAPGNPGLELFRVHGGPGLVIPETYAGLAAGPVDALRVTRALASYSPSLAVATTMHHFSAATLFTLADSVKNSGMEWALLEGIATQQLLVASGFSEGRPGQGILTATMKAARTDGGYVVNGAKKPCSLSSSMDLLTASVSVPTADGSEQLAVLLIPAGTAGISVHPFWGNRVLAGAESDEIRLTDVFVHDQLLIPTEQASGGMLDELQTVGFIWFELLISASYVGMASALVERAYQARRTSAADLAAIAVRLETAAMVLENVARMLAAGEMGSDALAAALLARYGAQDAITDTVRRTVELLGGMEFIAEPTVAYLASASHCLGFHPPSRASSATALAGYLSGDLLRMG